MYPYYAFNPFFYEQINQSPRTIFQKIEEINEEIDNHYQQLGYLFRALKHYQKIKEENIREEGRTQATNLHFQNRQQQPPTLPNFTTTIPPQIEYSNTSAKQGTNIDREAVNFVSQNFHYLNTGVDESDEKTTTEESSDSENDDMD